LVTFFDKNQIEPKIIAPDINNILELYVTFGHGTSNFSKEVTKKKQMRNITKKP
jgi:hypothetical protein